MRFLPVLLLLLAIGAGSAEVLVFDKYDAISSVDSAGIHIKREMTLTNVARNPVIPGELHFKIYQQDGDVRHSLTVANFEASNANGQKLTTKIVNRADETDLSVTIWDPMLPGFSYTFRASYDVAFEPSGLLFYELHIPREDTTIPIKQSKQTVLLDTKYHVTYAPDTAVSKLSGNTVVSWAGNTDSQVIEYSSLPLPRISFGSFALRAVNVFWGIIIIILIGLFVLSVRRARASKSDEEELERLERMHREGRVGPPR